MTPDQVKLHFKSLRVYTAENVVTAETLDDLRDLALQSCCAQEGVWVPREHLQDALNYIKHCGTNAVVRGQPHPQQQIVDQLETALATAGGKEGKV